MSTVTLSIDEERIAIVAAEAARRALVDAQGLSSKQAADVALAAAKEAVRETQAAFFALLGVNIGDAKEMAKFAADIEFLRAMHSNAGAVGRRAMMFIVTAFLGAMVLAIAAGLRVLLAPHGPG